MSQTPRVLVIAGSDSSGGAGIQADLKTLTRFGVYGATAITAITVQNTRGVSAIHAVPIDIIKGQIDAVLSDVGADAIKIGMLGTADIIDTVAEAISEFKGPIVVDPVMVATSGSRLLAEDAVSALKSRLVPMAHLLTPNLPEAEILLGHAIAGEEAMREAGQELIAMGAHSVLLKGGHMAAETLVDVLISERGTKEISSSKIETRSTHGTGCTMASAFAAGLAKGEEMDMIFDKAHAFVASAIKQAPGLGSGAGPIDHLGARV